MRLAQIILYVSLFVKTTLSKPALSTKFSVKRLTTSSELVRTIRGGGNTDYLQAQRTTMKETTKLVNIVFSDVDGTLVHYPDEVEDNQPGNKIVYLPASSTGMRGIISSKSLELCQKLRRQERVKLVLVSGMRTSTLIKRLPYLPKADAYCSEGGGRIFFSIANPNDDEVVVTPVPFDGASEQDLEPFGLREDETWRLKMSIGGAGDDGYIGDAMDVFLGKQEDVDVVPLKDRQGALWNFAKDLEEKSFVIDYTGYSNCFRINMKQQTQVSDEEFNALKYTNVSDLGLDSSVNLGCIDFYPKTSGKRNCCGYLAHHFNKELAGAEEETLLESCICLCDDDNDLEMASACGKVFLPTVTSVSMQNAVKRSPNKIIVIENKYEGIIETKATEKALSRTLLELENRSL